MNRQKVAANWLSEKNVQSDSVRKVSLVQIQSPRPLSPLDNRVMRLLVLILLVVIAVWLVRRALRRIERRDRGILVRRHQPRVARRIRRKNRRKSPSAARDAQRLLPEKSVGGNTIPKSTAERAATYVVEKAWSG